MTGTGKTIFALWCLSRRSYDRMPWVVIDAKRDGAIAQIPRMEEIGVMDKPPKKKGIYVMRPMPGDFDDGYVTQWLYKIWEQERVGIYIDEGYMFKPLDRGLRTVLTQGRSKHLPVIALSQRPAWISPFIHSESEFKTAFYLQNPADVAKIAEWFPRGYNNDILQKTQSWWYGMPKRELCLLGACPPLEAILDDFDARIIRRSFI